MDQSLQQRFYKIRDFRDAAGDALQGVRLARDLWEAVDRAQLFSSNEMAEDVQTGDLKFLLLPFYRAEFLTRCPSSQPSKREGFLESALELLKAFTERLWNYGLCGETAREMFRDEDHFFCTVLNPSISRNQKIARYKRERWLKTEIDRLKFASVDEDREREIWKMELETAFLVALSEIDLAQQELKLLKHRTNIEEEPTIEATDEEAAEKLSSTLTSFAAHLQKRERKQQIFRPSHILPTMMPEQFAEIERQRAIQASSQPPPPDRTSVEEEDVYRERAWDDWKDDHPRGYGNSKLKPCS